jgi:Family of unknown function (DUF6494)
MPDDVATLGEILNGKLEAPMDEGRFNLALRGFLKEVGVTSQREVEKFVRESSPREGVLRLRMVLTSPDAPALNHVIEQTISLA